MARTTKTDEVDEEVVGAEMNGEDKRRISITVDPSTRKNIRIAAAFADMTDGEWCLAVLDRASAEAVRKGMGGE